MVAPHRVLIVDDDDDLREVLRDLLAHEGYETRDVGLGTAAIEQMAREPYDAVLLDMHLPDTPGQAVLRALRSLDPHIPVIVLTGYPTEENTVGTLLEGAFAYVTKPHNPHEIRATIRRALAVRALEEKSETIRTALSASEIRFRSIVQSAPDAIVVSDHAGLIISWNRSAQRLFQYTEEEVLGQPVSMLMPERYREAHRNGLEGLAETGQSQWEGRSVQLEGLKKDGTVFPLELSVATWVTAEGRHFSGIIRDITERKRAEQVICESQDRFRQLAEYIEDVFWLTDPTDGTLLYVSPAYERIWGRSCESRYGSPSSWLDSIYPEDRDRVLQAELTRQVQGTYDEEYRIVRPDGTIRWIHDRAFPVRDDSGAIVRIAGLAADITDQKLAHEALRRAHERVTSILASLPGAMMIADASGTIRYANPRAQRQFVTGATALIGQNLARVLALPTGQWSRLVRALTDQRPDDTDRRPRGELVYQDRVYRYEVFPVSLEPDDQPAYGLVLWDITDQAALRDQLIQAEKLASLGTLVSGMAHEVNNPVQGILSTAELIQDERDPDRIKAFAADIVEYARHVGAVVRNFSSYARPSSRDNETDVDLCDRLREAIKMAQRSPQFDRIELVTQLTPVSPVRARRTEIDQIFVNLISNAVQAMHGEGRLTVSTREHGSFVEATVSDTGCGIPESLQSKIFDPFFTTKESGKGTGLGLSIVHKIVMKYGGLITVKSRSGEGSAFRVEFPLSPMPPGSTTAQTPPTDH